MFEKQHARNTEKGKRRNFPWLSNRGYSDGFDFVVEVESDLADVRFAIETLKHFFGHRWLTFTFVPVNCPTSSMSHGPASHMISFIIISPFTQEI